MERERQEYAKGIRELKKELLEEAEQLEPPPPLQTTVTTLAELGLGLAGDLHGACLRGEDKPFLPQAPQSTSR